MPVAIKTAGGETRRNLITNPAFRTNLTDWSTRTGGGGVVTLARGTGATFDPQFNAYAQVTLTTAGTWWRLRSMSLDVVPGREYTFSSWVRGTTGTIGLLIVWYTASGGYIYESTASRAITGDWTRVSRSAVAPEGAATARIELSRGETTVGTTFSTTGALFEESSTMLDYFDGATTNTADKQYVWQSTANGSMSLELTTTWYPTALERYRASREGRTLVHTVLNSTAPDVTFRPFGLRSGSLAFVFDNAKTAHDFLNAAAVTPQTLALTTPEVPGIDMKFVVAGDDLGIEQDDNLTSVWYVSVPFSEVPA